jgi:hypothetical protein
LLQLERMQGGIQVGLRVMSAGDGVGERDARVERERWLLGEVFASAPGARSC